MHEEFRENLKLCYVRLVFFDVKFCVDLDFCVVVVFYVVGGF